MKTQARQRGKQRRGLVATEFAITLPIVLMFFFAAFEICRFSMLTHTVENAAYEGARAGVVPGATAADVEQEARNVLQTLGINDALVQVEPTAIDSDTTQVQVAITVPFGTNSFVPAKFFQGAQVQRQLTMRREGQ
jgi:Flp pilus assembly protein TadG